MASITPNSETFLWDTFFTATRAKFLGRPKQSVYREPSTYKWVKSLQGGSASGTRGEFGVILGSFAGSTKLPFGSLDTITVQDAEISTQGWVNTFTYADLCGISEQKMKANEGKERKYNYVEGQLDQMIAGQKATMNTDAWATSQDALAITSLANGVSTTTTTTSFENLSRATYSNWRQTNTDLSGAAFSASGLNGFRTIYHTLSKIGNFGPPDVIFMSGALHATYERITDAKEITQMADGGGKGKSPILSEALVFRTCEIIWEPTDYPDATTCRFFNSSTWHYENFQEMLPGKARQPANGLWYAYPVVHSGRLICDGLRANGLVSNFTNS